ncbi:ribonuclease HI [Candidatus Saccharibacteria bacterium]|nr:ribonuclease HI [Candidatus Saccharibacteria bacterium]
MRILWTDGSASPNPGPGGFAVIENGKPVALGNERLSSNIRMEGKAMISAIKLAGEEGCEIHSDSEFWINVLTKWAPTWEKNGWTKKNGEIKNLDIVKELYELYKKYPVELVWVRGHVGTELNELADEWANKARKGETL